MRCGGTRGLGFWRSLAQKLPELIQRLAMVLLGRTLRFIRPEEHRQRIARVRTLGFDREVGEQALNSAGASSAERHAIEEHPQRAQTNEPEVWHEETLSCGASKL